MFGKDGLDGVLKIVGVFGLVVHFWADESGWEGVGEMEVVCGAVEVAGRRTERRWWERMPWLLWLYCEICGHRS